MLNLRLNFVTEHIIRPFGRDLIVQPPCRRPEAVFTGVGLESPRIFPQRAV